MFLKISAEIALQLIGVEYPNRSFLSPLLETDGYYYLNKNVLNDNDYASVHGVLSQCEIVNSFEVIQDEAN
jgi:hypothetical protein